MGSLPVFGVDIGIAERAAQGNVSGDSYFCRRLAPNLFAVAISDGMGTGSDAAAESKLTLDLLSEMLVSGINTKTALQNINAFLIGTNTKEIFATLDLAIFDLSVGYVTIFKMSAAPTVIIRDGTMGIIRFPSLPLGITEHPNIRSVEFPLKRYDRLLFISDGISEANKTDTTLRWMSKLLAHSQNDPVNHISGRILWAASMSYGHDKLDDMTIITVKIQ